MGQRATVAAQAARRIEDPRVEIRAPGPPGTDAILTPDALAFVGGLERRFGGRIDECLARRRRRIERLAEGTDRLDFLADTRAVREAEWTVAAAPRDLVKRVVEITGPVDRKMIINALNSGADVFMADFEDATSPTWANMAGGQRNLFDAVRGEIDYTDPASGKSYRLGDTLATLLVRPRGLHLPERHLLVDGRPAHGAIVDFGLYCYHNAATLLGRGSGPYFYLPKLESHLEARLWNEIFLAAQDALGVPRGSIRATVLIETLPAVFEMDEILHELREHASGLNCGRWDYIFSHIKTRRHEPTAVFPDRSQVTMAQPCMRAYSQLAIRTCHRRGAYALGGMSAYIPVRDASANEAALAQVRADKEREAVDGHDGTWVAHPGLVDVAREVFAARMTGEHQLGVLRADVRADRDALLEPPAGTRTEGGLRLNARVGIQYLEAWLRGHGAVPLYNLMEDAATAEISRAQVWQWVHWGAKLVDGRVVTRALVEDVIAEEMRRVAGEVGAERMRTGRFDEARDLFAGLALADELADFLTLAAYDRLDAPRPSDRPPDRAPPPPARY
ncbi:MAG TPA: malate synthase A [Gemmatimonadaceae bacterium]|nr:malate synthase A [Gemmatimonadaceae bacterium]